ncbi:MAG: Ig domain protein group 2 domain protein [Clostridiaceae bacterium]|jgi:uncharacterized protein YjdB|nr:Ig domain protein group 2 domain protein [Clostridiaceae bacterium]
MKNNNLLKMSMTLIILCCLFVFNPLAVNAENMGSLDILVGDKISLETVIVASDINEEIDTLVTQFTSDNNKIARIDASKKLIGVSEGQTIITAKIKDNETLVKFTVNVHSTVTGVELDKTNLDINVGEKVKLTANILPTDAFKKDVTWSTDNPAVAKVVNGVVTGVKEGKAIITVTTVDGGYKAICEVTVTPMVTGLKVNTDNVIIEVGKKFTLDVKVYPENAFDQTILYEIAEKSLIRIDKEGTVTGLNEGETVVHFKSRDGGFTGQATIVVVSDVEKLFILDKNDNKISSADLNVGEELEIIVTDDLSNSKSLSDYKIKWTTSDKSIATIRNGKIKAISNGTATITATVTQDSDEAKIDFVVNVDSTVTGVSLNKDMIELKVGENEMLTATVYPENAVNKNVKWSSSNSKVVKVIKGKVYAVSAGDAVITVTTEDGGYTASCLVSTISTVDGIIVPETNITIKVGDRYEFSAVVIPEETLSKKIKTTVSDKKVVKALQARNSKYNIVGLKEGTSVVTLTTLDGASSIDINVTVVPRDFNISIYDSDGNLIIEN